MSSQESSLASERNPLLADNHLGQARNETDDSAGSEDFLTGQRDDEQSSVLEHLPKLCATMFDFFTSGCLMAAVGVCCVETFEYSSIG